MEREDIQQLVIAKFREAQLDPCFGCAIIEHESNWNPNARSPKSAADEKYGGAWGLCQILPPTAKDLGYDEAPEGLWDPTVNIELFIKLTQRNIKHWRTTDVQDLICMHNSGRPKYRAPESTLNIYLPAVMKHYKIWSHLMQDPLGGFCA
jgi:hypothetical protein